MSRARAWIGLLCAGLLVLAASAACAQSALRQQFAAPPRASAPMIRWWWPGTAVQPAELGRELSTIAAAGFGGVEIQASAIGLPADVTPAVYGVGTAPWFDLIGSTLTAAQGLGLAVDLTFGSAWPAGGPTIDDGHALRELALGQALVTGGSTYDGPPPAVGEPLYHSLGAQLLALPDTFDATKMSRVAVVAMRLDDDQTTGAPPPAQASLPGLPDLAPTRFMDPASLTDLSASVDASGRLTWQAPAGGDWIVFAVYEGPAGQQPFYAATPGVPRVLDPLDSSALQLELDAFAAPLRQLYPGDLGTTLRSLFVDSLEFRAELFWTHDFADEFARRRGYRVETLLPLVFQPFANDAYLRNVYPDAPPSFEMRGLGDRIRADYRRTVSELMNERFFVPLHAWTQAAGMTARYQGHGGPVDDLAAYRSADVPETEGLYAGGQPAFLKRAAAAAHQGGRTIVSSEVGAFHLPDDISLDQILRLCNLQFAGGVNQLVLHGYPYLFDTGFAWPGWMPFDSPYLPGVGNIGRFGTRLNERSPLWPGLPPLLTYLSRTQLWLRDGAPVIDLAVLGADLFFPDRTAVPATLAALDGAGYLYDPVDEAALEATDTAVGADGTLQIGAMHYRALVLDDIAALPPALLKRIGDLAAAGLRVVFRGQLPGRGEGMANYPQDAAMVAQLLQAIFATPSLDAVTSQAVAASGQGLFVRAAADLPDALAQQLAVLPGVDLGAARGVVLYQHRRAADGSDRWFFVNTGGQEIDSLLTLRGAAGRTPEIWDAWSGNIQPATLYADAGSDLGIAVHLQPGGALAVGLDAGAAPAYHALSTATPVTLTRLADGSIEGTVGAPGTYTVALSDGQTRVYTIGGDVLQTLQLDRWALATGWTDAQGILRRRFESNVPLVDLVASGRLPADTPAQISYTTYFPLGADAVAPNVHLMLDLGQTDDAVQVLVNDQPVLLAPVLPYRAYIDGLVAAGLNKLQVILSTAGAQRVGLFGPASITPRYAFTVARPVVMSVVVTPPNFPNQTYDEMIAAVDTAAEMTNMVNFQWFWRTPPSAANPAGGDTVGCDTMLPLVLEARRLGLGVTLQFQTYYVELAGAGQLPLIRVASPVMPFDTATFGDPTLKASYLEQIACLAAMQPEYLVLGPEMNFAVTYDFAEFNQFQIAYAEAYRLVKKISPKTQVGISWQYDGLRMSLPLDDWGYVRNAGPQDFYALTSYYGFSQERHDQYPLASSIPADYYYPIKTLLSDKPVIFSELGWSSYFPPGEPEQAAFMRRVPELLSQVAPAQVTWALLHDVSYFEGAAQSLNASGLRNSDGSPKQAWNEVQRLRQDGTFTGTAQPLAARTTVPFSITAGPVRFPQQFSMQAVYDSIAQVAAVTHHVSIQVAWVDEATGQVWDCAALAPVVAAARQLGLDVTLQWNTYATRPIPGAPPGALPEVLLFNPIRNATSGMADPPSIGEPAIRDAWLSQVQCIAGLKPDYLVLGPEINFVKALRPAEFQLFAPLYGVAYQLAKAASPNTRVGLSYQYEVMHDDYVAGRDLTWIPALGAQDFVGLTLYFAESDASLTSTPTPFDVPDDYFATARTIVGPDVPIVFTEIGWSSHYPDGLDQQVTYLSRLPALLAAVHPANVIWSMLYDLGDYFQGDITALNQSGLLLNDGTVKPAWLQVQRMRALGILVDP